MTKPLRCAVYTRKSTEEGLDQTFNSLHAQREAGEAYIKSQAAEGWILNKKHYDDGGYSGGTMDRPALQDLLRDIERGLVNVIVVYKIDRLSRSLADFARLVELFDAKNVTFVSVTQHFNTTTSMGRLTLNVLLSFAQFEREVTGERIRDKIAASKKKGMWMGGTVPMGYDVRDRKLVVNEPEAELVRLIYQLYLQLGTVRLLAEELGRRGVRSKVRMNAEGNKSGGFLFQRGQLYTLLRNRTYLGEIAHRGSVYPGEHPPIVDRVTWDKAQALLASNRRKDVGRRAGNPQYLLTGLLRDDRGNAMTPHHTQKKGTARYAYYVSQALIQGRTEQAGTVPRVAVREIETVIENALLPLLTPDQRASWVELPAAQRRELVAAIVDTIELGDGTIQIQLKESGHGQVSAGDSNERVLVLPFEAKKRGGQTQIHPPAGIQEAVRTVCPAIATAMVRAWKWRQWFESGEVCSLAEAARREGCTEAYVRKLLPMAFLAPDLIDVAIHGALPRHLKIADLARQDMPLAWDAQRRLLGTVA